jgi:gamma-glutamyltranspeptidase/glutathione hydrolase
MLDLRRADFPLGNADAGFGWLAPNTAHVMAEAMGLAFADRFYWMGGNNVAGSRLIADCYLAQRGGMIKLDSRITRPPRPVGDPFACGTPSVDVDTELAQTAGGDTTTHFSVLDKWGNAVSFTTTLTDAFGSGILVPGYGIVLNNALSNFNSFPAAKTGVFPSAGDPGSNDAGSSKRAMGNTAPLIAMRNGEPVLITGSPGGASIPSIVLNVVTNVLDHGLALQDAVDRPRVWFNMTTFQWHSGVPDETIAHVRGLGHGMAIQPAGVGGAQSIGIDGRTFALSGAKDRLIPGATVKFIAPN